MESGLLQGTKYDSELRSPEMSSEHGSSEESFDEALENLEI